MVCLSILNGTTTHCTMGQVALRNSDATSRALKVFAVRGATALLCDGDMVDALKIIPGSGFFTEVEARASQVSAGKLPVKPGPNGALHGSPERDGAAAAPCHDGQAMR